MVEIGMLEIALSGGGVVVGYILGKMNGSGAVDRSDNSTRTITDNRNSVHGDGNVSGKGKNIG